MAGVVMDYAVEAWAMMRPRQEMRHRALVEQMAILFDGRADWGRLSNRAIMADMKMELLLRRRPLPMPCGCIVYGWLGDIVRIRAIHVPGCRRKQRGRVKPWLSERVGQAGRVLSYVNTCPVGLST